MFKQVSKWQGFIHIDLRWSCTLHTAFFFFISSYLLLLFGVNAWYKLPPSAAQ